MSKAYYQKKPVPEIKKKSRRCIWENCMGIRCKKKAKGYFFCEQHLRTATKIESCSYSEYDYEMGTP